MSETRKNKTEQGRKRISAWWLLLLLLLLLVLFGFLARRSSYFNHGKAILRGFFRQYRQILNRDKEPIDNRNGDGLSGNDDTLKQADSAVSEITIDDKNLKSDNVKSVKNKNLRSMKNQPDTAIVSDTSQMIDTAKGPCFVDTVPPWVIPDPSGGMYRRHVAIHLLSVEPCEIEWRYSGEKSWRVYSGEPILITSDTAIEFTARDTCGNVMPPRSKTYRIVSPVTDRKCPSDMEYVKVADVDFCIDRYEWPNRRGNKPRANISIYQAMDSCFTAGKRLCSTDEWTLACGGAYGWRYPYGAGYEQRACNTRDTSVSPSGQYVECRGFFDVYDMSGNLAEWTSTPAARNKDFFNVLGGFWESGPQANCRERRHSYFPQNRHNPVGFRCCREADTVR